MAAMRKGQRDGFSLLRLAQAVTAVCLGVVGSAQLATVLTAPAGEYETAEWFVNYAAGFIRRGLSGEILFAAASLTGAGALAAVKVLGTATLFAFLFIYSRRVARIAGLDQSEKFALLFMPTGLGFVALNGNAMLRKDWLLLLVFWGFVVLMEREPGRWRLPVFLYLAAAGSFAVLMHEIFFVLFMPYCAVFLWARLAAETGRTARAAAVTAVFLALPGAVAVCTLAAPAPDGAAMTICEAAKGAVPSFECTPLPRSLGYLEMSTREAIRTTGSVLLGVRIFGLPSIVTWCVVYLLLTRILYEIWWRMLGSRLTAFLLCAMNTGLIAGISLVGWDYGRWIFLMSSLATLLCTSRRCAPDIARLAGRLDSLGWTSRLPEMSTRAYRASIATAGLSSLAFRLCLCCAGEALDFIWPLHDLMKYYRSAG